MLVIVAFVFVCVFYLTDIIAKILPSKSKEKYERELQERYIDSFSVSEYYDRTQQQLEFLQAEKENQEPYAIILWLGIDGLRLNDDGSFEWVRKRKKQKGNTPAQFQQVQNAQVITGTEIQTQISLLRYKLLMEQTQAAQIQQTQNIINSLQSSQYPQYISYPSQCSINTYTTQLPQLWKVSPEYMMNRIG